MFITVDYDIISSTSQLYKLTKSLDNAKLFAADFEVCNPYTKEELELIESQQIKNANGLSHPSLTRIILCSIATSIDKAFVVITKQNNMLNNLMNFLVTTETKQIWHNVIYDFKHILYHTGKIPKNWEDTMLMAKVVTNNANNSKISYKLKSLQKHNYGDWGILDDITITMDNYNDEKVLKYAAIDSCATFNEYLKYRRRLNNV